MASTGCYFAKPGDAEAFARSLLLKSGLPDDHAELMARCLVQADTRGVASSPSSAGKRETIIADMLGQDTHGMARLQQYIERVNSGLVKANAEPKFTEKTPVAAHLDGDNAFGFIVATKAMESAIKRAETYGIGIVTANHSNHFGMAATYVLQALDAGMISLVFTNSAKQMPPFGGKETLLGISPFAAGAPSKDEIPYILDMAPSVVAKGKIRKAARRGEKIPLGWAYDENGKATEDADAALNGSMAPIGGPKGSGIAILMDIMSGVLSGAEFGGQVGDQYKEARPQNVGHCFIAIKPDVFIGADEFRSRMDTLVQRVHGVTPAEGFEEVLFPGEPEHRLALEREKQGIPYADAEKKMFDELAEKYGVQAMPLSSVQIG